MPKTYAELRIFHKIFL